jgi:hypothetical protein
MYTFTMYPSATAVTSGNNQVGVGSLPPYYRISWSIGGTSPSLSGTISAATLI